MIGNTAKAVKVPFVDLAAQHAALDGELKRITAAAFRNTDFILGDGVAIFEDEFADYCGTEFAVGVDSGTSALELALRAYGIGAGDEVITAANTFIATVLAISYVDAQPVLVDADPQTFNIDPARIEAAITPQTKAIMPVHLYGQPADMDPILEIAARHDLIVIEDACQAHGAMYKGRRVGSIGHAAAFSFYPAKNLGACGDGGMVVTSEGDVAADLRALRNYGSVQKYHHPIIGYNRRLDTLQAEILRAKLRKLDDWNIARRSCAHRYNQRLQSRSVTLPYESEHVESVYHLYVIRVAEGRDALMAALREQGIATGIHYPVPVHLQPAYHYLGYRRGDFPITERYAEQILSLPIYAEFPTRLLEHVVGTLNDLVSIERVAA